MNWSYTTKSGELQICEWSTCFELINVTTGESHFMGDGVDMTEFQVGTPQFYNALIDQLEADEEDWLDYFEHKPLVEPPIFY
jgi:hypothetical protein